MARLNTEQFDQLIAAILPEESDAPPFAPMYGRIGQRRALPEHLGVDVGTGLTNQPIFAPFKGKVTWGDSDTAGRWVVVESTDERFPFCALIMHCVKEVPSGLTQGLEVQAKRHIAWCGNTGRVIPLPTAEQPKNGIHLHYDLVPSSGSGHPTHRQRLPMSDTLIRLHRAWTLPGSEGLTIEMCFQDDDPARQSGDRSFDAKTAEAIVRQVRGGKTDNGRTDDGKQDPAPTPDPRSKPAPSPSGGGSQEPANEQPSQKFWAREEKSIADALLDFNATSFGRWFWDYTGTITEWLEPRVGKLKAAVESMRQDALYGRLVARSPEEDANVNAHNASVTTAEKAAAWDFADFPGEEQDRVDLNARLATIVNTLAMMRFTERFA